MSKNPMHSWIQYFPIGGAVLALFGSATWIGATNSLSWRPQYTVAFVLLNSVLMFTSVAALLMLIMLVLHGGRSTQQKEPNELVGCYSNLAIGTLATLFSSLYLLVDGDPILRTSRVVWCGSSIFLFISLVVSFVMMAKEVK